MYWPRNTAWLFLMVAAMAGDATQAVHPTHRSAGAVMPEIPTKSAYLRFIGIGDVGSGGVDQKATAAAMTAQASRAPLDFVLMLGDNFYPSGVSSPKDPQWDEKFAQVYKSSALQLPFYAILGNHDYRSNPRAEVAFTQDARNTRWTMPARYYSFSYRLGNGVKAQFFALDTTPIEKEKPRSAAQIAWLKQALEASDAEWKIVFGHHPLYSGGKHGDSDEMIDALERLFIEHHVNIYLSGHDHIEQMLKPVGGVHYLVSGVGAMTKRIVDPKRSIYAVAEVGFTLLELSANRLVVEFVNSHGEHRFRYAIDR